MSAGLASAQLQRIRGQLHFGPVKTVLDSATFRSWHSLVRHFTTRRDTASRWAVRGRTSIWYSRLA
jgi:hypothetical protein